MFAGYMCRANAAGPLLDRVSTSCLKNSRADIESGCAASFQRAEQISAAFDAAAGDEATIEADEVAANLHWRSPHCHCRALSHCNCLLVFLLVLYRVQACPTFDSSTCMWCRERR